MPNWCLNRLIVSGPADAIEKLADAASEGELLATIIPEPDYTVTPVAETYPMIKARYALTEEEREAALRNEPTIREDSWWDWRIQNWGTKWDPSNIDIETQSLPGNGLEMTAVFDSAWSPPVLCYEALVKQGIEVEAYWVEPGNNFGGRFRNGVTENVDLSDTRVGEIDQELREVFPDMFDHEDENE